MENKPQTDTLARWQRVALVAVGIVAAIALLLSLAANIWTEYLWYDSLGHADVYTKRLVTGAVLFVGAFVFAALVVAANVAVALTMSPKVLKGRVEAPSGVSYGRLVVVGVPAGVVGFLAGMSAINQVDTVLAWLGSQSFGVTDPYFGRDVSFYVFSLPLWQYVTSVALAVVIVSGLAAAAVHVVLGAARQSPVKVRAAQQDGQVAPELFFSNPLTGSSQGHLSIVAALALVVYGIQQLLNRYEYSYTDNALFTGVGYSDDHSRITAKLVVAIICFICAGVFAVNVKLRRWNIALSSLVLLIVSSVVLSGIYPAVVQRFSVKPDEPIVESPYIAEHILATRAAFGIDGVEITDYSAKTEATAGQLRADAEALPGIRLMDPEVIAPTFEQLQQVRGYYSFPKVLDVDRYTINGTTTDAIIAAREIDLDGVPDRSWTNIHTVYTHGYAMVAAYGNRRQPSGEPQWIVGDIPPKGELAEHQARIYFGESTTEFAIVGAPEGTAAVELDTPGGGDTGAETRNTYAGSGGVPVGGFFNRLLFALRFTDMNLLLSDRVNDESVILFDRTPTQRVQKLAPWLTVDTNPFPAIVDGRVVWIVDAYTTSANYPNSQHVDLATVIAGAAEQSVNYMRNSVKATVDALDGTVTLYAWDVADPILATWMNVFPTLLTSRDEMSTDLLNHMRYPQDIFKVQREVLGRYHTTNPDTWYQQSDLWRVPSDPRATSASVKEPPYYLSIKWPGDDAPVFSTTAVYVPSGRENLGAYLAVVADASHPDYGKLRVLKLSDTQQIAGPGQTFNAITTDQTVADKLLPYTKQGSAQAIYGNLLTLPLGGGLIYVEPIYTQRKNESSSSSGSYPVLRFVVVRFGEHIGIGDTLQQALDMVFQGDSGANTGETGPTPTDPGTDPTDPGGTGEPTDPSTPGGTPGPGSAQELANALMNQALEAFAAADAALAQGNLAEYQAKMNLAKSLIEQAVTALG